MTTDLTLDHLIAASSPGGSSALAYSTELTPAAGRQASIAPAKYVDGRTAAYAYERRFLDGTERHAVVVDSKQSSGNRLEQQLQLAVDAGEGPLSGLPHLRVDYGDESFTDLTLPHRAFDGHVRAGTVDGKPVTQTEAYRAIRNSNPANARALFDASPVTLVLGGWDSSRKSRQGRWRSILVGEIMGYLPGDASRDLPGPAKRGGARVDPVGMSVQLAPKDLDDLVAAQAAELSGGLLETAKKESAAATKSKSAVSASRLGLGGVPPSLNDLAGVSCERILRTRVLSFAALRQIRFGGSAESDIACRTLLAALAVNGVARADAELDLRANCDLREAGPVTATLDLRGGSLLELSPPDVAAADGLLQAALDHATTVAGVSWTGEVLRVVGNPAIVRGAVADGGDAPE
jgi:CRISPR-associated protein Csb1